MSTDAEDIERLLKGLPSEFQKEVKAFVESLVAKHRTGTSQRLRQDWAGGLRDYRDRYTSLDLQQKALEWRGD